MVVSAIGRPTTCITTSHELIVLQFKRRDVGLTAAETAAERELLDRHMAAWLGGLAPVVSSNKRGQTTFERGFVAVAEIINHHDHSMWDAHVVAITPPWRAGLDPRSIEYVRAPGGGHVLRP